VNVRHQRLAVIAAALAATLSSTVSAQQNGPFCGMSLVTGIPSGEFNRHVGASFGFDMHGGWRFTSTGALGLRLDGTFLVYGSHTERMPFSSDLNSVMVDVTTSNWIGSVRVGPQLTWPGDRLRPYLRAQVGFAYFATDTSLSGSSSAEPFATTNNFDDTTLTTLVGGGVYWSLVRGVMALDVGGTFVHNNPVEYLIKGDLTSASITTTPHRSAANIIEVHVGLTFLR
jgi:hypothetical protein